MSAAGIGHNGGPELSGQSWRAHCWRQARERLLPTLPIEVVRLRVRRAAELGLDYKTYAGVRASTGHDLVAFLFSSNALGVFAGSAALAPDRQAGLARTAATKLGLATHPLSPARLMQLAPVLATAGESPSHLGTFAEARARIAALVGRLPRDTVLLIGDHPLEGEWAAAGRLAGYLPAERYFAPLT